MVISNLATIIVFSGNENLLDIPIYTSLGAIGTSGPFSENYFRMHGNGRVATIVLVAHVLDVNVALEIKQLRHNYQ